MLAEKVGRIDGHGAIEKDRNVGQPASRFQPMQMKKQGLRAPDRERRDYDCPAAFGGTSDDFREQVFRVSLLMAAIAVCGFHDNIIGAVNLRWVKHG